MIRFEWDIAKAQANKQRHGVSFDDAASVFSDQFARLLFDPEHSQDENRYILLGLASSTRLLVVCHCYREDDEVIRLISARKANRQETEQYWSLR